MAVAFVAERGSVSLTSTAASTLAVTVASDTTGGNRLVLVVAGAGTRTVSSVTDSRGNTWAVDAQRNAEAGSTVAVCSAHLATALLAGDVVTVTFSGTVGKARGAVLEEFSGVESSSAVDKTATAGSGGSTALSSGATAATAQANEVAVGAFVQKGQGTLTPSGGYTKFATAPLPNAGSDSKRSIAGSYKVLSATGAQTAAAGSDVNDSWMALVVTYKASAAVPQDVTPDSVASAESVGNVGSSPGAVDVSPDSVGSGEAFGVFTVIHPPSGSDQVVSPAPVLTAEVVSDVAVTPGAGPVTPDSVESGEFVSDVTVYRPGVPTRVGLATEPVVSVGLTAAATTVAVMEFEVLGGGEVEIGATVRVRAHFRDENDMLVDPTTVKCVDNHGGSETANTAVHEGLGVYYHDIQITEAGYVNVRMVGSGTNPGAVEGGFHVRASQFETPLP